MKLHRQIQGMCRYSVCVILLTLAFFTVSSSAQSADTSGETKPAPEQGKVNPDGKFTPRPNQQDQPTPGNQGKRPSTREEAEAALAKALKVTKIDENRCRIGLVTINKATKTISFPAKIEKRSGPIEYALVTANGKIHESLLSTEASPMDVHLAALLLGIKPNAPVRNAEGGLKVLKESALSIRVAWKKHGKNADYPLGSLILSPPFTKGEETEPSSLTATPVPVEEQLWCYNGSFFHHGHFLAQKEGSFIAVMSDGHALMNNTLPSRQRDDLFTPNKKQLPAIGRNVTVQLILKP